MHNQIKIQLIEDDPAVSLRVESIIHTLGYQLLPPVDNSDSALAAIEQRDPDIIIMDINIKGANDGIEVAEIIKDKNIPIIFLTGYDEDHIYKRAKQLRPVAYLVKPFNRLTLQSALENGILSLADKEIEGSSPHDWDHEIWLEDSFFVKRNNMLFKVRFDDIQYIQSEGNYCNIVSSKKHAAKISLTKLLKKIPSHKIIRIHQRYAIHVDLIQAIDISNNRVFIGNEELPIGPKYRERLLNLANRL